MSGLRAFLGTRDKPSLGSKDTQGNGKSERIHARMVEMGFNLHHTTKEDQEVLETGPGRKSTFRQTIGDQQRVATPPFIIHGNRTHPQNIPTRAQDAMQIPEHLDKPAEVPGTSAVAFVTQDEPHDCFDTDIEGLEDITATSKFKYPMDGPSHDNNLAVDTNHFREQIQPVERVISTAGRSRRHDRNNSAASSESEHSLVSQQSSEVDELGLQEINVKATTPGNSQLRKSTHLISPTASLPASLKDKRRHPGTHIRYPHPVTETQQASVLVKNVPLSNEISSKGINSLWGRSKPSDHYTSEPVPAFAATTEYLEGNLNQPNSSNTEGSHVRPMPENNKRRIQDTVLGVPTLQLQPVIHTQPPKVDQAIDKPIMFNVGPLRSSCEQEISSSRTKISTDIGPCLRKLAWAPKYDMASLSKINFKDLVDEPFDPAGSPTNNRSLPNIASLPLAEALLQLHQPDIPDDEMLQHRQTYFSSLDIDQYDECGELIVQQFSEVIAKYRQVRRRKRQLARRLEDEITVREQQINIRKGSVEQNLSHLKSAGRSVIQRSTT